jgi:hypothetical protein
MNRVIEILITPAGQTRLETRGFAGDSCREASRSLEQALGRITEEQPTAEFHQPAETENEPASERLRQGEE